MFDRLTANWPLKLLSLVLATTIWVSVTGEQRIIQDVSVPIDLRLPEDRILASDPPTTVKVRLRGPETLVRRMDLLALAMTLDLSRMSPGEQEVQLSPDFLKGVPSRIVASVIEPTRVRLVVESRRIAEFPVEPDLIGELPDGYTLYDTVVQPSTVLVEGPASGVESLTRVRTNPIRLDGHRGNFVAILSALTECAFCQIVDPRPIEIRMVVDTSPIFRTFDAVPVVGSRPGTAGLIEPGTVRAVVSGPRAIVDRLAPSQVRAVAELSGNETGDTPRSVPVRFEFPGVDAETRLRLRARCVGSQDVSLRPATSVGGRP